jgi:hypothetical protein
MTPAAWHTGDMPQLRAGSSPFVATALFGAFVLGAAACAGPDAPSRATQPVAPAEAIAPNAADATAVPPALAAHLQRAAASYEQWGRVDEHPALAPTMCAAPVDAKARPAQLRRSAAGGGGHGQKLYYLWASDRELYLNDKRARVPAGFTIVKQSFAAEPATATAAAAAGADPHAAVRLPDGSALVAGAAADLFVMIKLSDDTAASPPAETDAGWIYGTVAPSGRVTSAGRVASCMRCHERIADRLFGLPAE